MEVLLYFFSRKCGQLSCGKVYLIDARTKTLPTTYIERVELMAAQLRKK
jgi:hypothetical protein